MTAFSVSAHAARVPAAIVQLGPGAFAPEWPHRPANAVSVGLSLLSAEDIVTCRAEASKKATELHPDGPRMDPNWNDAHNDELFAWVLSRSLCNCSDASEPYFAEQGQDEDIVKQAFTPATIRHLWDELERATISLSPVRAPATDEELADLGQLLADGAVTHVMSPFQLRLRKLASFMLDQLAPIDEDDTEDDS